MSKTTVQETREAIEAQVASFLEGGNEIEEVPVGMSKDALARFKMSKDGRLKAVAGGNNFNPYRPSSLASKQRLQDIRPFRRET